jgi:hypothetical protein
MLMKFGSITVSTNEELLATVQNDIRKLENELEQVRLLENYLLTKLNRPVKKINFSKLTEQILREANYPLKTNEIVERIINMNYDYHNKTRLINSVYSSLKRNKNIVKIGMGLWKYKDERENSN